MRVLIPVSFMHYGRHIVSQEIGPDHPKYKAELKRRHRRAVICAARFATRHPATADRWRSRAASYRLAFAGMTS